MHLNPYDICNVHAKAPAILEGQYTEVLEQDILQSSEAIYKEYNLFLNIFKLIQ